MNDKCQSMPPAMPPATIPPYCENFEFMDSISMTQFLRMFVHIWTLNGDQFWMYATQADDAQISGYTWQKNAWHFMQVPYDSIDNIR